MVTSTAWAARPHRPSRHTLGPDVAFCPRCYRAQYAGSLCFKCIEVYHRYYTTDAGLYYFWDTRRFLRIHHLVTTWSAALTDSL